MIAIIEKVYQFLWGDWIVLPLPGGSSFRFSLLVLILICLLYTSDAADD